MQKTLTKKYEKSKKAKKKLEGLERAIEETERKIEELEQKKLLKRGGTGRKERETGTRNSTGSKQATTYLSSEEKQLNPTKE